VDPHRPGRAPRASGAMAGGRAAACVAHREGPRQKILRETELADEFELVLADPGGLRSLRPAVHLVVTIRQEHQTDKQNQRT